MDAHLLACPVCGERFSATPKALICPNNHNFDIARQGYVNLLRRKPDTLYENKALFAARRAVYQAGFFDPMIGALAAMLSGGALLDAGCGEGSLLARLCGAERQGVGMDIARPAVQMAAAAFSHLTWCVADLCAPPLPDGAVDAVLNVLTPANYAAFARVLAPGGALLKVIPGADHLSEIRALAGKAEHAQETERVLRGFDRHFIRTDTLPLRYEIPCDAALAAQVYAMTPLTAHTGAPPEFSAMPITVDLVLVRGEPSCSSLRLCK
ncbi:MAG: methyltransferase domain-containing protein [Oscillospiraceae bacterium]|jgi:23S rRNA (guanine745-N1)-methyltransferase|nr:methyltransferase domain-containing protein [Oscillospiraceae bacterium]